MNKINFRKTNYYFLYLLYLLYCLSYVVISFIKKIIMKDLWLEVLIIIKK